MDENGYYLWFTDQCIKSSLQSESLGLVLAGQPIGVLTDLTTKFEKASRRVVQKTEPADMEEEVGTDMEVVPHPEVTQEGLAGVCQGDVAAVIQEDQTPADQSDHVEVGG